MSVLQGVLVFVLVPAGIYALIVLLAAGRGRPSPSRYRPGEPWRHEPVWWTANPAGAHLPEAAPAPDGQPAGTRGGADGGW